MTYVLPTIEEVAAARRECDAAYKEWLRYPSYNNHTYEEKSRLMNVSYQKKSYLDYLLRPYRYRANKAKKEALQAMESLALSYNNITTTLCSIKAHNYVVNKNILEEMLNAGKE